jgi:hypothetical protein
LGQALDNRRLADAGLADEYRVILLPAGKSLDDALDFPFPADNRVELVLAGKLGQVAGEIVKRRGLAARLDRKSTRLNSSH